MFTLVGGHISPILVACENLGIRVIDTRHEVCPTECSEVMPTKEQVIDDFTPSLRSRLLLLLTRSLGSLGFPALSL